MTYGSRLRAEHEQHRIGNWPNEGKKLPEWLLDLIAQEQLLGGYKVHGTKKRPARNPVCPNCFVAKSNNKSCNCTE